MQSEKNDTVNMSTHMQRYSQYFLSKTKSKFVLRKTCRNTRIWRPMTAHLGRGWQINTACFLCRFPCVQMPQQELCIDRAVKSQLKWGLQSVQILRSTVAFQVTKLLIDQTDIKAPVTLGPAGPIEPLADKPATLSATPAPFGPAWWEKKTDFPKLSSNHHMGRVALIYPPHINKRVLKHIHLIRKTCKLNDLL